MEERMESNLHSVILTNTVSGLSLSKHSIRVTQCLMSIILHLVKYALLGTFLFFTT